VGSTGEVDRPAPAPPALPLVGGPTTTAPTTTAPATSSTAPATTATTTTVGTAAVPRPGLQAWLAADQGVVADASGKVSRWTDQSGTTRDATQTNAAAQPTLRANAINGKPGLYFDGTDDALSVAVDINPATTPNLTVVTVFASATNATTLRKVYSNDDGGYDRTAGLDNRAGTNYAIYAGSGVRDFFTLSANTAYQTTDAWTPTQFTGRVNGRNVTTQPVTATTGLSRLTIGSNPTYGEYWMGPIAEILVYNRLLSAAEQSQVESYLAAKYRI
jgi:hypothetical protein